MKNLSIAQKKTFEDLQKPTMSLIASFYEMTDEIEKVFVDMISIYEANPTEETAQKISDKIMGLESTKDKKEWINRHVTDINPFLRSITKKKYLNLQQSVPRGIPTSGMLLVGLGVVSKAQKDLLMEAQAAARLISHVNVLDKYQPKTNYQNADGTIENAFLDKPFATKIQRLEHLVNAVVNDIYTRHDESEKKPNNKKNITLLTQQSCKENCFLQKARNEALKTLSHVAHLLKNETPTISKKISDLENSLRGDKKIDEYLLSQTDFQSLKKQVEGRPIAPLVAHRTKQILSLDTTNVQMRLSKNQTNR